MRKIWLMFAFLLNLIPQLNGNYNIGIMTASAQSYGNEGYYTCETEEMGIYTSPFPCDVDVEIIRYECEFCGCFFDTKIKRDNHEEICGSAYYCTY